MCSCQTNTPLIQKHCVLFFSYWNRKKHYEYITKGNTKLDTSTHISWQVLTFPLHEYTDHCCLDAPDIHSALWFRWRLAAYNTVHMLCKAFSLAFWVSEMVFCVAGVTLCSATFLLLWKFPFHSPHIHLTLHCATRPHQPHHSHLLLPAAIHLQSHQYLRNLEEDYLCIRARFSTQALFHRLTYWFQLGLPLTSPPLPSSPW